MRILFFVLLALFIASLFVRTDGSANTTDWQAKLGGLLAEGPRLEADDLLLAGREGDEFALSAPVETTIRGSEDTVRKGRWRLLQGQSLRIEFEPRDDQFLKSTVTLTAAKPTVDLSVGKGGARLRLVPTLTAADQPLRFRMEAAE